MFGRVIEGERVRSWGARAIYNGYPRYDVDLLVDRQSGENMEGKEAGDFLRWLNKRALPWLRKKMKKELQWATDCTEVTSLTEGDFYLEATCNGSYGYLYVGAIERPAEQEAAEEAA